MATNLKVIVDGKEIEFSHLSIVMSDDKVAPRDSDDFRGSGRINVSREGINYETFDPTNNQVFVSTKTVSPSDMIESIYALALRQG